MPTIYVSIGNSDDKLTQQEWATFILDLETCIDAWEVDVVHGAWHSNPKSTWQNACWCFEIQPEQVPAAKTALRLLARKYEQDSIAWAVAETQFLSPT